LLGNVIAGEICGFMRPTVEDLQAIWLFTNSRSSLLDAANFLAALSRVVPELGKVTPESLQYRALAAAAVISYGRPFTTCFLPPERKRVVPLADVPPPPHLAEFHDNALTVRNTMIGHKDATPAKGYTASANIVLVRIYPDKDFSLHAVMPGQMDPAMKSGLSELCAYFVKHCEANINRLIKVYGSELMKHQTGQYELVISEPPADWLVPFRPRRGENFRSS
jgi:hypothetical protein